MRLNGWQRLWVAASLAWVFGVSTAGYLARPKAVYSDHHSGHYYYLPSDSRSKMYWEDSPGNPVRVKAANGKFLLFLETSSPEDRARTLDIYNKIVSGSIPSSREKVEHLYSYALFAIIPCILVAALGALVAWVRRGFHEDRTA